MADNPMLKFVSIGRDMPEKREAEKRREDFGEIYAEYAEAKAAEQSSRCSQCGVPYCQSHCPLHNNIPDWLKLTAEGRLKEAYEVSQATNTFPEICGRICPQDRLCEGNCVIEQSGHGTVTIGSVEKYITDTAWDKGWVSPIAPATERTESVGIIGAGPGGLAAADRLRRAGLQVTIYDRYDRGGGLLVYGIPGFKLEKDVVARRVAHLETGGVTFHFEADIGRTIDFSTLRAEHDTILIATGVYKPRTLSVPGMSSGASIEALDYLTASNRAGFGEGAKVFKSGVLNAEDKRVVVIGGGDTAMDCVRTAVRQGAKSVTCLYRRDKANMPGSGREVQNAEEEGVKFEWLAAPDAVLMTKAGAVKAVRAGRMKLGPQDASGRQAPEKTGESFEVKADMVICALGFDPEDLPSLWGTDALKVNRWGAVKVDFTTMMTSLPGVFAAGDIVRGGSLVVWPRKDGRDAAEAMHAHMAELAEAKKVAAE